MDDTSVIKLVPPPRLPSPDAGGPGKISQSTEGISPSSRHGGNQVQVVPQGVDGSPVVNLVPPPRLPSTDAGGYAKIPRGTAKPAVSTSDRRLRSHAIPPGVSVVVGDVLAAPVRSPLQTDAGGAAKIPRPPPLASDSTPAVDLNQQQVTPSAITTVGDVSAASPRLSLQSDAGGAAENPRPSPSTSDSTSAVGLRRQSVPPGVDSSSDAGLRHSSTQSPEVTFGDFPAGTPSSSIAPPEAPPKVGRLQANPTTYSVGTDSTHTPPTYDAAPSTMFLAQLTPETDSPKFSLISIVLDSTPTEEADEPYGGGGRAFPR